MVMGIDSIPNLKMYWRLFFIFQDKSGDVNISFQNKFFDVSLFRK